MSAVPSDHTALVSRIAALEQSLERVADGYLAFDPELTCTYANQGGARLLGLSPESLMGVSLRTAVPDAMELPLGRVCLDALRMRQPAALEAYSELLGRWFSYRAYPDAGGVSVCIHGIASYRDTDTARKQHEQRLETLLEHLPEGILVADPQSRQFVFANQAICRMLGYSAGELMGLTPDAIHPEAVRERVRAEFSRMLQGSRHTAHDIPVLRKDGSTFSADIQGAPVELDGKICICGVFTDRTWQQEQEDSLRRAKEAAERRELLLLEAQDIAEIGYWELDLEHNRLFWSDQIYSIFGQPPQAFDATYEGFLSFIHPEDRSLVEEAYRRHLEDQAPYDLVHRIVTAGQRVRYVRERCKTTFSGSGAPLRSLGVVADVTRIREAEQARLESESRYRTLFEQSPVGMFAADETQRILFVNQQFTALTGYCLADMPDAATIWRRAYPEPAYREALRARWDAAVQEAIRHSGSIEPMEVRVHCKDGSTKWFESGFVFTGKTGIVTIVDISARKQAEAALQDKIRELEAARAETARVHLQLEMTLDRAVDAVVTINADKAITFFNESAAAMFGFEKEEVLGKPMSMLLPEPMRAGHDAYIDLNLRTGQDHVIGHGRDFELAHRDGTQFWGHIALSKIYADGKPQFTAFIKDITDRRQAEETMRHYAAALEQRSVQLNTLINTLPDLVWLKNPEGVYLRCNPRFESLMGCPEADVIGKNDFDFFEPELARFFQANDQAAIAAGGPRMNEELLTFADGHQELVETTKTPLIDPQGRLIGVLGIAHDITERNASEEALRRSELQFRTLFDESPVSIIVHDKDTGEIVDANPVAWQSYGCGSLAELQQQHFWLDPPYAAADALENIRTAARQGHLRFEWRNGRADGSQFWEQVDLRLLTINGTERVLATSVDITARKEAELALETFSYDLGERLKEMSCLASLSKLIETPGITAARVLQGAAALLPPAFQFVSAASACICFDGARYESEPCAPSGTVLRTSLSVGGELRGSVEVYYDRPLPFLREETDLLEMVKRSLELFFERETASAALRDSEERLRLAITAADQGLYDLDVQTGETVVSPEYARMLGYDPADFNETHAAWLERMHPEDQPGVAQAYRDYVAGRTPEYRVEFRQQTASGGWIWILSLGKIQAWDPDGHPLRMLGTHTDITARKLAEESLRESERKYRALFELSPVGMIAADQQEVPVLANRQFELLTGYTLGDLPAVGAWWEIICPDESYRTHIRTRWDAALRQADPLAGIAPMEVLARQKSGEFRYLEIGFMPTGTLNTLTVADVHERKLAEVALRESEAKYRDLIEHSPIAMAVVDSGLRQMILVNRKLTELTGYTLEDIPTVDRFVRLAYPDEPERSRHFGLRDRVLHSIVSSGEIQDVPPVSARIQCKDGSYRHVEASFVAAGQYVVAALVDLTERTLAEEALRAERDLFSAGPVFTIIWEPAEQWPVEYVSGNVMQILGYSPQEMRDPAFRYAALIHPDDLERVSAEVSYNFKHGIDLFEQSYRLRLKNGAYRWFYDFTKLIRDESGEVRKIRGYLFDQTNLKELETALTEERQRLDYIITGTHAGTWEWNVQTGETVYNPRWAEMLGYTLENLAPLSIDTWKQLTHPDDLEQCMDLLAQHFEGKRDYYEAELRMRHRDGRWIWVQDRGKISVRGKDGNPLLMSGTHLDITLRKQAEEALQESEARYRGLLEAAPVGIAVQQGDRIVYCNPAGLRLMGAASDAELIGKPVFQVIHPDDLPFAAQLQRRLMAGETSMFPVEVRFVRTDGTITDVDLTASLITYREAPAIQIIATDITERKQHLQAIEAQNKILKDIAWTQSHVVRAPLARLMGLVGLLEEHNFSGFSEADMLRYIMASASELDQIIRNISEKAYTVGALEYETSQHKRHPAAHTAPKHIELLIIDDDPLIQKLHKAVAVKHSLHESPQTFSGGQEALDFIRSRNEPDTLHLLLLDINMPGMSGWDMLEALRAEELACTVAVVMLTSSVDIADRIKAQRYPQVVEYLTKPINKQTAAELKQHPRLRQYWEKNGGL